MDNFRPILRTLWTISCEFKALFFLRGEIQYTPSERRERYNPVVKGEGKGERSGYRQDPVISIVQASDQHNPYGKREGYGTHKKQIYDGWARPSQWGEQRPTWQAGKTRWASRDPHPVGRDPHPLGHQPGYQGEWASIKETFHTQGLQPVH